MTATTSLYCVPVGQPQTLTRSGVKTVCAQCGEPYQPFMRRVCPKPR